MAARATSSATSTRFTHEMRDLIEAVATGTDPTPSFADALQVQLVLDAVEKSASSGSWQKVEE